MKPLAELALDATRSGRLTLIPSFQEKIWEHWLTNIRDWCISRQLWWGHRIPVYTCEKCKHELAAVDAPEKCPKCGATSLTQDNDVLDTWCSSWLWPFAVHNWENPTAEQKADLDYFYPTDIIVTGNDIIFFWIARMVMAGEYFLKQTPFHHVYFNSIVRDDKGRKMSKSLGNSPDIFAILEKYGTDAMRFSLANQLVIGSDILWDDDSCDIGRHFANKLWNCARFLHMNCEKLGVTVGAVRYEDLDTLLAGQHDGDPLLRWITSEFYEAARRSHKGIEAYEFAQYSSAMYEFAWMKFCDWFVELIKPRFGNDAERDLAARTLRVAFALFDGVLRLLHPLMPYVTEALWQGTFAPANSKTSVGLQALPQPDTGREDAVAIAQMREVQAVVSAIRVIRGQYTIHPGTELSVTLNTASDRYGRLIPMMEFLAKARFAFGGGKPALSAASLANGIEVFVDLTGHVDVAAEKTRLQKRIEKVKQNIAGTEKRLQNAEFVRSAPAQIVKGAEEQLEANRRELTLLQESLAALPAG